MPRIVRAGQIGSNLTLTDFDGRCEHAEVATLSIPTTTKAKAKVKARVMTTGSADASSDSCPGASTLLQLMCVQSASTS